MRDSAHYRGYTLVDIYRSRYACKDGTLERIYVCKENENAADALRKFRAVVDKELGA